MISFSLVYKTDVNAVGLFANPLGFFKQPNSFFNSSLFGNDRRHPSQAKNK